MFLPKSNHINLISTLLQKTYFISLFKFMIKRTNTIVLMYHGVADDNVNIANNIWLQVKTSDFKKQMEYIKENYNPIHLDNIGEEFSSKKPNIVVTFDDGYRNNYINAFPILKQLGIPATIFTVTSMIDSNDIFWFDRLRVVLKKCGLSDKEISETNRPYKTCHPHDVDMKVNDFLDERYKGWEYLLNTDNVLNTYGSLTSNMILEMDSSGLIKFGSHTHRHEIVTSMGIKEFEISLRSSLEKFKKLGIAPSNYFCFPNGWYNSSHIEILKKCGFNGAVTTKRGSYGLSSDSYQIPRIGVGRQHSLDRFATMIATSWI